MRINKDGCKTHVFSWSSVENAVQLLERTCLWHVTHAEH